MYQITEREYQYLEGIIGKQVAYYKANYPHKVDEIWSVGIYAIGKACSQFDNTRTEAKFTTYASSAIMNEIRHWHRSEKKTLRDGYMDNSLYDDEEDNFHQILADSKDEYLDIELRLDLANAINKLTPKQQRVVNLKLKDLSNIEIAEQVGVKRHEISRILNRAYKKLKEELEYV